MLRKIDADVINFKSFKSQSAMEYLMTYGWSILVIAVVIGVLFALGVFNSGARGSTSSCIAFSGWQCTTPILYSSGTLSLTLWAFGQPITITGIGCSSNSTVPSSFQGTTVTLSSGQSSSLTTSCPLQSSSIGSAFSGKIWVQYYYNSNPSSTFSVVVANVKASVSSGGVPGGYTAYVPISITNTQSSATPSGFQQMIFFNPNSISAYTSNEALNLGNIRFYQGGQELYSWCESGCNSITSSNAVFWVNIPAGISASNTIAINMYFLSNTVAYDGVYAGEAPAQSSSYAQYDNGGSIFPSLYQNFFGSGLPSGWQKSGTVSQNNGISVTTKVGYVTTSTAAYGLNANQILDMYLLTPASAGGSAWYELGYVSITDGFSYPDSPSISWSWTGSSSPPIFATQNALGYNTNIDGTLGSAATGILSVYWSSTSSATGYQNYASVGTYSSPANVPISQLYAGINNNQASGTNPPIPTLYWIRLRSYPPNGVMPTTSFGTISH